MHRRQIAVLALLLTLPLAGCGPSESSADTEPRRVIPGGNEVQVFAADLPFEQVRAKLCSADERAIVNAIVQMVTMNDRQEVAHLLNAAWQYSRSEYPDLNWHLLGKPRAKVALAQVLGSWDRADPQFRSYILENLDTAQGLDKVDALIALGAVAVEGDIPLLEGLSRGPDELAAAGAMSGLQVADTNMARQALTAISNDETVPEGRRKLARQLLAMPRASDHRGVVH